MLMVSRRAKRCHKTLNQPYRLPPHLSVGGVTGRAMPLNQSYLLSSHFHVDGVTGRAMSLNQSYRLPPHLSVDGVTGRAMPLHQSYRLSPHLNVDGVTRFLKKLILSANILGKGLRLAAQFVKLRLVYLRRKRCVFRNRYEGACT